MNATKAGRPVKTRSSASVHLFARFYDARARLYVVLDNGAPATMASALKATAAHKTRFAAAYAKYQAAGGAL